MDEDLSSAVQLYLGYDSEASPQEDRSAVTARFGPEVGAQLIWRIEAVMRDAGGLKPDWETQSLLSAKEWAEAELRSRHPDLNDAAISALGWAFSFWWK